MLQNLVNHAEGLKQTAAKVPTVFTTDVAWLNDVMAIDVIFSIFIKQEKEIRHPAQNDTKSKMLKCCWKVKCNFVDLI